MASKYYAATAEETAALAQIEAIIRALPASILGSSNAIPDQVARMYQDIADEPRRQEWKARRERAEKRAETHQSLEERWTKWARSNLKVGMIVKVSGTRDGKGYRRVTKIHDHGRFGLFEAEQLELKKIPARIGGTATYEFAATGYKTDHGFGKVRGEIELMDPVNGKPVIKIKSNTETVSA
jgi:hypothetical protein